MRCNKNDMKTREGVSDLRKKKGGKGKERKSGMIKKEHGTHARFV